MTVNPSMTLRSTAALVFICGAALASLNAQEAPSERSEAGEFQKLDPALKFLRTRNARDYAVTSPNGIDEANYVKIGGLEQWITIRGEDRKNPVLLFLHGGPGDATNPWGYAGFRNWLKYFTVVQWDQRGAGTGRAEGVVGFGGFAYPRRSCVVAYAALVERAPREGNSRALRELNEV